MPGRTAWILADQLSAANPALEGADRALIVQSSSRPGRLRFHRQKLQLVFSAMRHFAEELEGRGIEVDYRRAPTLAAGLEEHLAEFQPEAVTLLEPSSVGAGERLAGDDPRVELVEGTLFLTDPADFARWAEGRKLLRMEDFYREQRRKFDLLMDGDEPAGGRWNYDPENREPPPEGITPPRPYRPREDGIDGEVREELDRMETEGLATTGADGPRIFPASRDQALRALDSFVAKRLPTFGPYQDAMVEGERFMWHALLSSSLNLGLLDPLECAEAAEAAWRDGEAPIESVEGFVRQVIGWREYVWGVYRLRGRSMLEPNELKADRPVPGAIQALDPDGTSMACLADTLDGVRDTAYAHHIERLMLLGNLMLTLGVDPTEATDWFHSAFIDGYEWVMVPNVAGMALWADGGTMRTQPSAATGRYVDRMSDYCGDCRYSPKQRTGPDACPLTTLYWDFLDRNRQLLGANHRMKMQVRNLDRIDEDEMSAIREQAARLRHEFTA
ncbi:MAG: cryptochrome/photolyase family protein [Solirubrobacterales bacterium]